VSTLALQFPVFSLQNFSGFKLQQLFSIIVTLKVTTCPFFQGTVPYFIHLLQE